MKRKSFILILLLVYTSLSVKTKNVNNTVLNENTKINKQEYLLNEIIPKGFIKELKEIVEEFGEWETFRMDNFLNADSCYYLSDKIDTVILNDIYFYDVPINFEILSINPNDHLDKKFISRLNCKSTKLASITKITIENETINFLLDWNYNCEKFGYVFLKYEMIENEWRNIESIGESAVMDFEKGIPLQN
jgi:hypothetical protein